MATTHGTGEPGKPARPEGIGSILDTDLYKLTMQCCVLKYFPNTQVTYKYTNRTPHMKFSREAYEWLQAQVDKLSNISLTDEELAFLKKNCPYLNEPYLRYLKAFRFKPAEQVRLNFKIDTDAEGSNEVGDLVLHTEGLWLETILYEIPLLALISETYFRFMDTNWTYDGQEEKAKSKGQKLIEGGVIFSEFGSRRRRDYHTHDLVLKGLTLAQEEASSTNKDVAGKVSGTSNVHFAMKYGIMPIGTVAHEWFMGVAAITDNYEMANELALRYWVGTFGQGVLGIALTDTFGTADFLKAFAKPVPALTTAQEGSVASTASMAATTVPSAETLSDTKPPVGAPANNDTDTPRFADVFAGTRQDSGDPKEFVATMSKFYDEWGISKETKTIVFSDSLNVEKCFEYKAVCEKFGLQPSFGVGTFFTNDFTHSTTNEKSLPLNIVIKISSAEGNPAVKISDNIGKNTGDSDKVAEVKQRLGYVEKDWAAGDESKRWGAQGDKST